MKAILDTSGSFHALKDAIETCQRADGVSGLMVLTCYNSEFTPQRLDPLLQSIALPLFGGCFPAIIHNDNVYETGSLVVGLPVTPVIQTIETLDAGYDDFDEVIDSSLFESVTSGTMVILVDGMFRRVNSILESVFNIIGTGVNYIGGGASSLDFETGPCLLTNDGFKENCAVLAYLPMTSGVGVAHGMESVDGPFKVTGVDRNGITSIEWKSAAEFYKSRIQAHPEYNETTRGLIGTDAHFSLGLNRFQSERIILEPVQEKADGALGFMQEVREGEFVNTMRVTDESMIRSATTARDIATRDLGEQHTPGSAVVFDCISRKLFLDKRFTEELKEIHLPGILTVGALTFGGEIGCNGEDFLDYHNRTCVVGLFEADE